MVRCNRCRALRAVADMQIARGSCDVILDHCRGCHAMRGVRRNRATSARFAHYFVREWRAASFARYNTPLDGSEYSIARMWRASVVMSELMRELAEVAVVTQPATAQPVNDEEWFAMARDYLRPRGYEITHNSYGAIDVRRA